MLAGLQHYQQQVARDVESAQEHYAHAASMQAQQDQVKRPSKHYLLAFGLMMGLPTAVVIAGSMLFRAGYLESHQAPLISFAALGSAMLGLIIYVVVWSLGRRGTAKTAAVGGTAVACPSCGAAHPFVHGQPLHRCTYCGAALLPTQTVIQAGLDAARAARRHAELERWRKERSLVAAYQGMGLSGNAVLFMALGPMILMLGVGCIAFSWQMATGEEPYSPGIFALWAIWLGCIAVLVGGTWWTRHRKSLVRAACQALAAQLGGHPIETIQQMVGWLNEYWAGPYESRHLSGVGLYGGAFGSMEGYAVLAELFGTRDKYRQPRVHLMVAAWVPGLSDGTGQLPPASAVVEAERQALAQMGFRVEPNQGGLLLVAHGDRVKRFIEDLSELGRLAPVLMHGVRMAQALGATPVARA
jgi:hypothetical protein